MAFNMSSNQTISLAGSALASDNTCEMGEQNLYNIVLSIDNYAKTAYKELIVDEDSLKAGMVPVVYGLTKEGTVMKIDNKNLTFEPALNEGKFATGASKITLAGTNISDNVTVA